MTGKWAITLFLTHARIQRGIGGPDPPPPPPPPPPPRKITSYIGFYRNKDFVPPPPSKKKIIKSCNPPPPPPQWFSVSCSLNKPGYAENYPCADPEGAGAPGPAKSQSYRIYLAILVWIHLENLKGKPEFNVGPLIRPLAKRH